MGDIESRTRQRVRKQNIRRAVLTTIGTAGVISVGLMAPNALRLLKFLPSGKRKYLDRIKRSMKELERRGYVQVHERGNNHEIELTKAGEILLFKLSEGSVSLKKPARWDRRWRIVIFDIPETRKQTRDSLRLLLSTIGFKKMQSSVWVYPYDCEDVLTLIKLDAHLKREVIYIVAEEVENDVQWRRIFNLLSD